MMTSAPTPREATFRETVVRELFDRETKLPYWVVDVREYCTYVFSPASQHPGWLSSLRFTSYEDATAFATTLGVIIRRAMDGHAAMTAAAREAVTLISSTHGDLRGAREEAP